MEAEAFKEHKKIVTDLDAILGSPGHVKLHGKVHEIKPILVGEFFAFANALASIKAIEVKDKITLEELVDAYYQLAFPVVPTLSKDDIRNASQSQIAALMNLIQSHVTGGLTDEKKKMMMAGQLN